jgi:glyoxylase-like metal-dependent hydrolase (beta-lactamase superfamily II)
MKKQCIILFMFLFLCAPALLYAQDGEVTIQIDSLSKDVYMLTGQGGNIGIYVGTTYVFMIDDQFDRLSDKIKAAIKSISDKPIAFLFNTHMHGDHSGGNASFNTVETTLVAHVNARERINEQQKAALEEQKIDAAFHRKMLPEVTYSEDITFHDGEETIMAFHVHNAHTDGDSEIYFMENNVIHMGDTYFAGRYPYIDLDSGGSVNGFIDAQKKVLMLINDDTVIIPGHGRPSNKAELRKYISMLEDIRSRVKAAIDAGKTAEEVKSMSELTAEYDEVHGSGFINPERIREIYFNSLTRPAAE